MIDHDDAKITGYVDHGESGADWDRAEDDAHFGAVPRGERRRREHDDPKVVALRIYRAVRKITTEVEWLARLGTDIRGSEARPVQDTLMRYAWIRLRLIESEARHARAALKEAIGEDHFGPVYESAIERFRRELEERSR